MSAGHVRVEPVQRTRWTELAFAPEGLMIHMGPAVLMQSQPGRVRATSVAQPRRTHIGELGWYHRQIEGHRVLGKHVEQAREAVVVPAGVVVPAEHGHW